MGTRHRAIPKTMSRPCAMVVARSSASRPSSARSSTTADSARWPVLPTFVGCVGSVTEPDEDKVAVNGQERPTSTSKAPKDPAAVARFVATIDDTSTSYRIAVKVGAKKVYLKLAHTASGGSCISELIHMFQPRMTTLLPIGASGCGR